MTFDPMPEVLDVDYLATYEWLGLDEGPEQTRETEQDFCDTLYGRLQTIFPNAAISVRLDGVQYATRGTTIVIDDTLIATDEDPRDVIAWAEEVCDLTASDVGADVFVWEDDDESPDDQREEDNFIYNETVAAGLGLR